MPKNKPKTDDVAIKVSNLSKTFILPHEKQDSLKGALMNIFSSKTFETQDVLEGLDLEIKKGEFFGIVGKNGSGKSTLLKLMAGIYTPTEGNIEVRGSLIPFIELGVGFNPELSGRENVFLNGALLGFTRKQMSAMYEEIVDFAELERFMDQKLKNYSSGMQVRLAFSIAIRADSDILLLDEVLAVGDEAFQKKCYNFFNELKKKKKTVVLVTHDMGSVRRFCSKALLIENGEIKVIGSPADVSSQYTLDNLNVEQPASDEKDSADKEKKREDKKVVLSHPITSLKIVPKSPLLLDRDQTLSFDIIYDQVDETPIYVGIGILYKDVSILEHGSIGIEPERLNKTKRKLTYNLPLKQFNQGEFKLNAAILKINDNKETEFFAFTTSEGSPNFVIKEKGEHYGLLMQKGSWEGK